MELKYKYWNIKQVKGKEKKELCDEKESRIIKSLLQAWWEYNSQKTCLGAVS